MNFQDTCISFYYAFKKILNKDLPCHLLFWCWKVKVQLFTNLNGRPAFSAGRFTHQYEANASNWSLNIWFNNFWHLISSSIRWVSWSLSRNNLWYSLKPVLHCILWGSVICMFYLLVAYIAQSINSRSGQSLTTLFSVNMHDFNCCVYLEHLNMENFVIFPLHLSIANYHRVLSFVFIFHGYEKSENLYRNGKLDYQTWDCKKWERPAHLKGRPACFFFFN